MSIIQLSIFDCDIRIQKNDWIFQQLETLPMADSFYVGDIQISRTERFYTVEKDAEYVEIFTNIESCYEFINRKLSHEFCGVGGRA